MFLFDRELGLVVEVFLLLELLSRLMVLLRLDLELGLVVVPLRLMLELRLLGRVLLGRLLLIRSRDTELFLTEPDLGEADLPELILSLVVAVEPGRVELRERISLLLVPTLPEPLTRSLVTPLRLSVTPALLGLLPFTPFTRPPVGRRGV